MTHLEKGEGENAMIPVTICCEHTTAAMRLRIPEKNICCIQCGLIQIILSPAQAARVRLHCQCMLSRLQYAHPSNAGLMTMTIDPSQLDLGGKFVSSWLIG
jgi:hypothetical protein